MEGKKKMRTTTVNKLDWALSKHRYDLPDWDVADSDEGVVWVRFYVDDTEEDIEAYERHGGPFDRGSADRYYGRKPNPHYYKGATYSTDRVGIVSMTPEEISAYMHGYETEQDRKDWG